MHHQFFNNVSIVWAIQHLVSTMFYATVAISKLGDNNPMGFQGCGGNVVWVATIFDDKIFLTYHRRKYKHCFHRILQQSWVTLFSFC